MLRVDRGGEFSRPAAASALVRVRPGSREPAATCGAARHRRPWHRPGCRPGLHGQRQVDVAEVFTRRSVRRVVAQGVLQCHQRILQLSLCGIEHRQVVVRVGQFGEVLRQRGKDLDRLRVAFQVGEDHALQEANVRSARLCRYEFVGLAQGLQHIATAVELFDVLNFVGAQRRRGEAGRRQHQGSPRRTGRHRVGKGRRGSDASRDEGLPKCRRYTETL